MHFNNTLRNWSRNWRAVLWAGHLCLFGLLLMASFEAYRIQAGASERNVEIYREYRRHDQLVTELRRVIWQASIYTRDFFIDTRPDRAANFERQLDELRLRSGTALAELGIGPNASRAELELKARFDDFLSTLYPLAQSQVVVGPREAFRFVQAEIAPRRDATGLALRDLSEARHQAFDNAQVALEASRRSAASRLAVILITCISLGVAVTVFTFKHSIALERESARRFAEVCEARRNLGELSGRLLEIQEEERKQLSRELHDEVGQTLTALRIEISRALDEVDLSGKHEHLRRARDLASQTVATTRNLSALLRPPILDDLGLEAALHSQVEQFSERSGTKASFTKTGIESDLPEDLSTCAYRIVQEALHNCEKHSRAGLVEVELRDGPDALSLSIRDDGVGFDPAAVKAGCGLLGMSERAARLGGTFSLDAVPGRGTHIEVSFRKGESAGAVQSHVADHCPVG